METNEKVIDYSRIPLHMVIPARMYIEEHCTVGNFLYCVITNDLKGAVSHADSRNKAALVDWVQFFYNQAPAACWGSTERYDAWVGMRDGPEEDEKTL